MAGSMINWNNTSNNFSVPQPEQQQTSTNTYVPQQSTSDLASILQQSFNNLDQQQSTTDLSSLLPSLPSGSELASQVMTQNPLWPAQKIFKTGGTCNYAPRITPLGYGRLG